MKRKRRVYDIQHHLGKLLDWQLKVEGTLLDDETKSHKPPELLEKVQDLGERITLMMQEAIDMQQQLKEIEDDYYNDPVPISDLQQQERAGKKK